MHPVLRSTPLIALLGLAALAAFPVPGCGGRAADDPSGGDAGLPDVVSFNAHIRPILAQNCMACHGGVKKSGGISWVFEDEAIAVGDSGKPTVVPGDPGASHMIEKVTSTDPKVRMPPPEHGPALKPRQIALLKKWIEQGADWENHWAFVPPAPVEVPALIDDTWSRNDVDRFVLRRLRSEGMTPSAEAARGPLLRRATLDLTGLPPTEAELDAFENDDADDAYERVVDRLLASPRYGERWATMWLDLARYADSKGLGQDAERKTIYTYRDWVVRAFNDDMPFDDFTVRQIAGDLLPDATLDDQIATAFHRNTPAQDEGGTHDEEFRVAAQMDRVSTTWQVWHGTTMSCVQCHAHPYDALRHDDYYRFMDFFNQSQDSDLFDEEPLLSVPTDPDRQAEVNGLITRQHAIVREMWQTSADQAGRSDWRGLTGLESTTNRADQLQFASEVRAGHEEFVFTGTPTFVTHTLTAALPAGAEPLQALRLDIFPEDLDAARSKPSKGFRLEQISAAVISADGTRRKVALGETYLDEPFPVQPAGKKRTGFAAMSSQFHERWAVFVFAQPLTVSEGDRIELTMQHGGKNRAKDLLMMRRGRVSVTDDPAWSEMEASAGRPDLHAELTQLNDELLKGPQIKVPVMAERPDHLRRETRTFVRGNWTERGELQTAGVPEVFHPLPDTDEPARLRMARWLVDEANPLSARVLVCRFWEQLFGTGLVETLEDFGSVGAEPSHPELLDFLALRLMHDMDWSMKALVRELVTSSAYRQDAASTPELQERDPRNRLLARGPRVRLTGEMVRDQVLALGGLLNPKMFGRAVRPEQPLGGWTPSHPAAGNWTQSAAEAVNRRSIYVHWQRSSPYPVFSAFDAPSRDYCSDRRIASNTPIQPLFTLNDPALFKATQAFGRRMKSRPGTPAEQIAWGVRLATGSPPSDAARDALTELFDRTQALYPDLASEIRQAWDDEVERTYAEKRRIQRKTNVNRIANAKRKKEPEPTNLPDPELMVPGPEDAFAYDPASSGYDAVAAVIMNLDTALNR